ncbi:hypothetical protein JCM33374_g2852 [Metschnikowia sp. JCM 33374]|nr:hypothetical protein JCM33374_g2852 [Metschnikowia sp. JCM 33374]
MFPVAKPATFVSLRFAPSVGYTAPCIWYRNYSGPSVKSYSALTSPLSVWWAQKVPNTVKLASALMTTAVGVTHIHPNTAVTLGPPSLALAYFVYRRMEHAKYRDSLGPVQKHSSGEESLNTVTIQDYDEADEANVLAGIENEFDSFRSQIVPVVRNKLLEYVIESGRNRSESPIVHSLLDENQQVGVHVEEDPETFVTSKAESETEGFFPTFISFSVPYFTSRNIKSRKRLGTLQVSMLEVLREDADTDASACKEYKLAIQAWPYKMFSKPERIC